MKFDVWPWQTIGHLFYATSSSMHHFVAIGEFKLELQSGNAQFGSKSTIFWAVWLCNLTYDLEHFIAIGEFKLELQSGNAQFGSKSTIFLAVWLCNLTYDLEHFIAISEFKLELQSGKKTNLGQIRRFLELFDLEIWSMTLKNIRAPLLCYFKLYASFRSHRWIQAGVIVWKRPIWVKIDAFLSHVTLKFDVWPWKTIEHLFYATSSFVHHFVTIGVLKLELRTVLKRAIWVKFDDF